MITDNKATAVSCISNKLEFVIFVVDKLFSLERKIKYSFQKAKYDLKENFRMVISKYVSLLLDKRRQMA